MAVNVPRIVVAMSGGVDSSVAAALLKEQGRAVEGVMLSLWADPDAEIENRCCASNSVALARRVAEQLDIPFRLVDAAEPFRETVVEPMMRAYATGRTPNPCLECNRFVRWGFLLRHALDSGAEQLATGHYAGIGRDADGAFTLLRGADAAKDQSYVLATLGQEDLAHTLFPVGGMPKPEVRAAARRFGLPVANRPDSQDLCFVAGKDYRRFLRKYNPAGAVPGPIRDVEGRLLGEHQGLTGYTIGQRKGLGLSAREALYVVEIQPELNTLVVGPAGVLGRRTLVADGLRWVAGGPPAAEFSATAKIRYRAAEKPADVSIGPDGTARVAFAQPLRDITPGQAVVFYDGERCLGAGVIRQAV